MKHRFRSALLGTALGDAWSYPYQLPPLGPNTPFPENLEISDDTQMTLALSAAMRAIDREDLDREAGMRRIADEFLDYYTDPDYDRFPGASTSEALKRLKEAGANQWSEVSTHSGGSGSIMRSAASALLAPSDQGVGWTVLQAILTHDAGVARGAAAMVACMMMAKPGSDLVSVAGGIAGDHNFDQDTLLTNKEKSEVIDDINEAMVRDLTGPDVPLAELISRVEELRSFLQPHVAEGDFEELYRHARKFQQIIGKGWDAGSCMASALLLTQLYLDNADQYAPHDFLHVAVNWPGNRNARAALTGGLIGAHLEGGVDAWEETRTYRFEPRYDDAIHSGKFKGFRR
ncbi:MAG TPA: ADP-ribosylglycohydrolase family protein [Candidatus Corynebacterium gallistercoris]|uniref:ADP-ribosylglycohydrolase family protein n=1 Tax=Candidatus Corynebacterium gallistercoris TaxID=2838530 RepID=A0A9D1UQ64_9CORY|nr:ADP-ribosylglycohydrolase family protein [Candidatus Corynebacterium gallistercoris]